MIKQGIKNYFINLKYFFTPLGTIALGFVFGLSVLVPVTADAISVLVSDVRAVLTDANIDFSELWNLIVEAVRTLEWSNPVSALQTMINGQWLTDTLNACINYLTESAEVYTAQLKAATTAFSESIVSGIAVLIMFLLLGAIGGFFLTKWLIRRNIAKRALWQYFLVSFVDSLISTGLVVLNVWFSSLWSWSVLLSFAISVFLFGAIALFEAHIVHGLKKIKTRDILTVKNILQLFAVNGLILIVSAVLVVLAVALTNTIVGIFIGIALTEIAFIVISLNAEAYVKSVAEKADEKAKETSQSQTAAA